MAEPKVAKAPEAKSIPADKGGLLNNWVNQSSELAERTTTTCFDIVRDIRGEINQRVGRALSWIEGFQQGIIKLAGGINDRVDQLSNDTIDAVERLVLGTIRVARTMGHGVTDLATNVTHSRGGRAAPRVSA
jgi:hypothetical protein